MFTELIKVLRSIIGDDSDTPTYSDARLQTALVIAAQVVLMEVSFSNSYEVDIINETISPDPTDSTTRDNPFITLITTKAACRLSRGESKISSGQAIRVKDGSSEVDLKDAAKYKQAVADSFCKEYQDMKFEYETTGNTGSFRISSAPFRFAFGGNMGGENFRY